MADRVVKVSLVAQVSGYVAGMEQVARKTREVGSEAEKVKAKLEAQSKAMQQIGTGLVAIGALAAVGVGLAIKKFAEFDQAMSNVKAATQESAENMDLLREAALEAGASTVFSATEAANAVEELGKAGLSTSDILNGGLDGALSLAAAGGLGVAEAAGIAATALQTFKLKGTDMTHVADLMAAGAGKAMGDVTDLAGALSQVGLVASSTGLSIEETTGTLSAFASKGLLGSDAGTSFKAMLQRLTPQSKEAADRMDELGISAYDAQGNFIGMEKFAGNLETSLKDLTTEQRNSALATIFGSDAVRAATVLYTEGESGIAKWNDAVDDSGYAAKVAADRLDNLAGDVEALGGAFDTALIKSGSAADGVLRGLVQTATSLLDIFNGAPPIVQQVALGLGVATTAVGLTGGAAFLAVPKIAAFKIAMQALGTSLGRVALAGGAITLAITAAALLLGSFVAQQAKAKERTDSFKDSLDEATGAFTKNTRAAVVNALQGSEAAKNASLFGIDLKTMTDAVLGNADALDFVNGKLAEHRKDAKETGVTSSLLSASFDSVENAISGTKGELADSRKEWKENKKAMGESTDGAAEAAPAFEAVTEAVDGVTTSVSDLADELDSLNGVNLDARAAARQLEAAYDDFDASVKENGKTLDRTTEKGRANESALDDIAQAALDAGKAIADGGGDYKDYQKSLETSREALLIRIRDLGVTGKAAEKLADDILRIPSKTEFAVLANTANAAARLQKIQDLINGIGRTKDLHISTGVGGMGGMTKDENGSVKDYYANGGLRENHVAQIAPAGAWRMWAEPETGGESYIPLAPAKRARSLEIWEETGKRLGVAGFANGYVTPVQYSGGGGGFGGGNNSTTNNRTGDIWNISTPSDPVATAQAVQRRQNRLDA